MKGKCERCKNENPTATTLSMFNTQEICMDCKNKERQHPNYTAATVAERQAINNGNMNFEGIGLPADL